MKDWVRTLFKAAGYFGDMADCLDGEAERIALKSVDGLETTERVADEIIELTERKIKLINLKVAFTAALAALDESELTLINDYLHFGKSVRRIAEEYALSSVSCFRRLNGVMDKCAGVLESLGFGGERLDWYAANFKLIDKMKKRCSAGAAAGTVYCAAAAERGAGGYK